MPRYDLACSTTAAHIRLRIQSPGTAGQARWAAAWLPSEVSLRRGLQRRRLVRFVLGVLARLGWARSPRNGQVLVDVVAALDLSSSESLSLSLSSPSVFFIE